MPYTPRPRSGRNGEPTVAEVREAERRETNARFIAISETAELVRIRNEGTIDDTTAQQIDAELAGRQSHD